jgi:hypothetical protein
MKNNTLSNYLTSFDSFFESETFNYISGGLSIIAFVFVLFVLYAKVYLFKYSSVEKKNKLKKNRVFKGLFVFGFFSLMISFVIIVYRILDFIFSFFNDTFLRIGGIVCVIIAAAFCYYIQKKVAFTKNNS